jgi:hypothetical protein
LIVLLLGYAALRFSPSPAALAIRLVFEADERQMNGALAPYLPAGVEGVLDEHYDPGDPDARLDVGSLAFLAGLAAPAAGAAPH